VDAQKLHNTSTLTYLEIAEKIPQKKFQTNKAIANVRDLDDGNTPRQFCNSLIQLFLLIILLCHLHVHSIHTYCALDFTLTSLQKAKDLENLRHD
jgi:hypothetical protein